MSGPEENKEVVNETAGEMDSPELEASQETEETPEVESADSEDTDKDFEDKSGGLNEELNLGQERVLEFISYVVVNLVDHPEDVTVDLVRRQGRDVYQVRVHNEDLGKVIGKGGQTARALRVMLTALSARTDQRLGLEIVE